MPWVVLYEQLAQDPIRQIMLLGQYLELPELRYVPENIDLQRQAGRINRDWRSYFTKGSRRLADNGTAH